MEKIIVTKKEDLNFFKFFSVFAFDIETTGFDIRIDKIVAITISNNNKCYYIPLNHRYDNNIDIHDIQREIRELFYNAELVIAHNAKFDLKFMKRDFGINYHKLKIFDTMIAAFLIDENQRVGLKTLVKKYLDEDSKEYTELFKEYKDYSYVKIKDGLDYACNDSIWTYQLYLIFEKELTDQRLLKYMEKIEMEFLKIIIDIELRGVKIDTKLLDYYLSLTYNRIQELEEELYKRLGSTRQLTLFGTSIFDINLGSNAQMSNILFNKMKFPCILKTDKGSNKCDIEHYTLLHKQTKDDLFLKLIEHKKLKKLYDAYLIPYKEKIINGRLYFEIIQHAVVTGRLSSRNPNIMQLPKPKMYSIHGIEVEIRKLFLPDSDMSMFAGDYSQEELRIAGVLSDDVNMASEFEKGFDMHLAAANRVFNLGLSDKELVDGSNEYKEAKKKFKKERDKAKAISFGLLFGKTSKGFAEDLGISETEANELVDGYFKAYPMLKKEIDKTNMQVRYKGYVEDLFGRRRRFIVNEKGYYDNRALRQAFNFRIQGSAASLLKFVCVKIQKDLGDMCDILFTVHDEIVLQSKEDIRYSLKNIMENIVDLPIKLVSDINSGNNYEEAK